MPGWIPWMSGNFAGSSGPLSGATATGASPPEGVHAAVFAELEGCWAALWAGAAAAGADSVCCAWGEVVCAGGCWLAFSFANRLAGLLIALLALLLQHVLLQLLQYTLRVQRRGRQPNRQNGYDPELCFPNLVLHDLTSTGWKRDMSNYKSA
jgi:hypothetical protein